MAASWSGSSGGYDGLNLCTLTAGNKFHEPSTGEDEDGQRARNENASTSEAELSSNGKVINT